MKHLLLALFSLMPLIASVGCNKAATAPTKDSTILKVDVSKPEVFKVADTVEFTGRTQTLNHVDLKARVTGYLDICCVGDDLKPHQDMRQITEGDEVKEGEILFVITRRPFEIALNQAKANLEQAKQQRDYNKRAYERDAKAVPAISKDIADQAFAAWQTAEAQVVANERAVDTAQQNLDWTTIRAPFDGRISKRMMDPGNDVTADVSILASIERIDPLYAYFDVDERTLLRIQGIFPNNKIPPDVGDRLKLRLGLANQKAEQFSHKGTLKVLNNLLDPTTGTLRMWGSFDNPNHDLRSGMFVRVEMQIGEAKPAQFVDERALSSDQGTSYLLVVGPDHTDKNGATVATVDRRNVVRGPRKEGLISVTGLMEGDRIIVSGLQTVRKGIDVQTTEKPMPRAMVATDKGSASGSH
jgi:RND family efflux transporter MFP subunit